MAKAYYSTLFQHSADEIWAVIRDFNNYAVWLPGSTSHIENAKSGDAVGAIRNVRVGERTIRQRLLALSDIERTQSYEFCEPSPLPVRDFRATLRVTPVVDGERAFVEWWATYDCAPDEHNHWARYFTYEGFATWLGALRAHLDRVTPDSKRAVAGIEPRSMDERG